MRAKLSILTLVKLLQRTNTFKCDALHIYEQIFVWKLYSNIKYKFILIMVMNFDIYQFF